MKTKVTIIAERENGTKVLALYELWFPYEAKAISFVKSIIEVYRKTFSAS